MTDLLSETAAVKQILYVLEHQAIPNWGNVQYMYNGCTWSCHSCTLLRFYTEKHPVWCSHFPPHLMAFIRNTWMVGLQLGLIFSYDKWRRDWAHINFLQGFGSLTDDRFLHVKTNQMPSRGMLINMFGWLVFLMCFSNGQEGTHHAGFEVSTARREKGKFCWGLGWATEWRHTGGYLNGFMCKFVYMVSVH